MVRDRRSIGALFQYQLNAFRARIWLRVCRRLAPTARIVSCGAITRARPRSRRRTALSRTSYYFWPPTWVLGRSGFSPGQHADEICQVDRRSHRRVQVPTQMTDESGQTFPATVNELLDRALGADGTTARSREHAHRRLDQPRPGAGSNDIIVRQTPRRAGGVVRANGTGWTPQPVTFGSIGWTGTTLSFTVTKAAAARGLRACCRTSLAAVPSRPSPERHRGGSVHCRDEQGVAYAFFAAETGS